MSISKKDLKDLVEYSPYDNRPRDRMSREEMLDFASRAVTTVFIRLRGDGHPVGAVVGSRIIDGEIYTLTNVFRAAYWNVRNDNRCCVVFDQPEASVTVIGHAEIIEDPDEVAKFFARGNTTPGRPAPHDPGVSRDQSLDWSLTPNRRLFHVIPEKFFGSDMRTLGSEAELEEWKAHGNSWGGFQKWRPAPE
jgi:Pyridoxamine 5'-phosphate oxidase